jgi:hypothetical protein
MYHPLGLEDNKEPEDTEEEDMRIISSPGPCRLQYAVQETAEKSQYSISRGTINAGTVV